MALYFTHRNAPILGAKTYFLLIYSVPSKHLYSGLQWLLQGVPKVRSCNFMHYIFWSKLYFYMKFLEDVYFSIKYMYSEFQ